MSLSLEATEKEAAAKRLFHAQRSADAVSNTYGIEVDRQKFAKLIQWGSKLGTL